MNNALQELVRSAAEAAERIADIVCLTPLKHSPELSREVGAEVYLKLENLQHTGSFKLRGASNRLMTLSREQRDKGCVAASSGNHGAAVAFAMQKLGTTGVIFVPEQTSSVKVDAIRGYGGKVEFFGSDGVDTEQHAREYARQEGMVYLSPYNDAEVVAGQATCGIEIANALPDVDAAFIAVGGGGLISGVGSVLKSRNANTRIFACQPEASAVMARSIEAGRILDLPSEPTLSDGTAGGIEADSITFEFCRAVVDNFVLVSEAQIAASMRQFIAVHDQVIEGAAAVAIAAMLECASDIKNKQVVVVICGGNVSRATLDTIQSST